MKCLFIYLPSILLKSALSFGEYEFYTCALVILFGAAISGVVSFLVPGFVC